MPEEISV